MAFGHVGVAFFAVGITLTSVYSIEKDIRLAPGESHELGGYNFTFDKVNDITGPNYSGSRGEITVTREGFETVLHPEKRNYFSSGMPMTEAGIDAGFTRDLFVALGEPLGDGAWAVRLYHKPFIRWIWLGTIIMALGGFLAATDKRYLRMASRARRESSKGPITAGAAA